MSVKIITDSTAYIPSDLITNLDISTVSLIVNFDNDSFREVDISNETFYKKIDASNIFPTSSQPTPQDFYDVFAKHVISRHSVIGIFISSKLSGTYFSAVKAKEMVLKKYPNANIHIIDSGTTCMQLGLAVIAAAQSSASGAAVNEIIEKTNNTLKNSRFFFTPKTLEYLKKGGRIGQASALIGSVLKIRPILTIKDGSVAVFSKVRTQKKAIKTILDTLFSDADKYDLQEVVVHHINAKSPADELERLIKDRIDAPVATCSIGPVIGLHVGPGAIGIGIAYCF